MTFENVKIVFYVSEIDSNKVIEQLLSGNINQIGNYNNCISWVPVRSSWTPVDGANPYIGNTGVRSTENEVRIEFKCKYSEIKEKVNFIKSIHPYEEVEIDIIPILDTSDIEK